MKIVVGRSGRPGFRVEERIMVLKRFLSTILVTACSLMPLTTIGADEYHALDVNQIYNLKMAATIGQNDGHSRYLLPAIIYQETKAGENKKHKNFAGIGQLSRTAVKEVLAEYPNISAQCGIRTNNPLKLFQTIKHDDVCGQIVSSKYMAVLRDRYGYRDMTHQIIAYQAGPIAAKNKKTSPYAKSVVAHMANLRRII